MDGWMEDSLSLSLAGISTPPSFFFLFGRFLIDWKFDAWQEGGPSCAWPSSCIERRGIQHTCWMVTPWLNIWRGTIIITQHNTTRLLNDSLIMDVQGTEEGRGGGNRDSMRKQNWWNIHVGFDAPGPCPTPCVVVHTLLFLAVVVVAADAVGPVVISSVKGGEDGGQVISALSRLFVAHGSAPALFLFFFSSFFWGGVEKRGA